MATTDPEGATNSVQFSNELQDLLADRLILSVQAQRETESVLAPIVRALQEFLTYRPVLFPRSTKSRHRILEKAREIKGDSPELTAAEVLERILDMAAGRLLVVGLRDVHLTHRYCREQIGYSARLNFDGDPGDYLASPKPKGWRGLSQDCTISLAGDGKPFPYELQFMTYFQHTWDLLQHHLYELARRGPKDGMTSELDETFKDLSERLYEMDKVIDQTRARM